jgi:transposase
MAAIVYQTNKKTGVTYAYESVSFWDKEKQQSRAKRTCIGRLDPVTQQIVPTRPRRKPTVVPEKTKTGPVPFTAVTRSYYGATYFFDQIGELTGVTEDLQTCFPEHWRQILSLAYYLILEDRNPLSRFPRWAAIHRHPHGASISSQRSSELFALITEAHRQRFFKLQGKRRVEREYLAYDSTSVSSYSKSLRQIRYGKNKDHEQLAQINLALLFGQQSRLPFYYRKLAGNIPDVKTLKELLADMNSLGYRKIKVVLDRGFYSAANINELYRQHLKFVIGARLSLKLVQTHLDKVRDTMRSWTHYSQSYQLYSYCLPISWDYVQARAYKKDTIRQDRRLYLHLYYSPDRALEDEKTFNSRLADLQQELISGQRHPEHENLYARYFVIKQTPVRGTKVVAREEALAAAKRNYGYFSLMSNELKDPVQALEIYRNKDLVEKAFDNLKERLNLRRLAVSSEQSLDGKIFVQFVALIYLSYITKKMQETKLFKEFTLQQVLDELDVIECFTIPGQRLRVGEITKRQAALYGKFDITPPASLQ